MDKRRREPASAALAFSLMGLYAPQGPKIGGLCPCARLAIAIITSDLDLHQPRDT